MYHIAKDYMAREYMGTTSSKQRMEGIRKQEDFHAKYARDEHNFDHCGGNGVNAYGGNNHSGGKFISRGHDNYVTSLLKRSIGVGNFSSCAKSYEHNSCDNYRGYERVNDKYDEHSPCDYYEGYRVKHDHYDHSYDREVRGENMHRKYEFNDS
ncbi:hypothetical protein M9H77_07904 [Catharanthus roseus]|uniref:Uncharacterized protein n=1 Tax=Catharanthus roseus TaxID=4058 RepID=A0ACC0BW79_CATRO|nr:hypothetical protein M9H77_07904 [Catharanthus roseus]